MGWAALVQSLSISVPVRRPSCIAHAHIRGSRREKGSWRIFDRRYWLGDGLANHITFVLRHEDLDLLVLKRIYIAMDPKVVLDLVQAAPLGIPSRGAQSGFFQCGCHFQHLLKTIASLNASSVKEQPARPPET